MAPKLGQLGVLDILLAGDTANLKRATKEGATNLEKMGAVARSTATSVAKLSAAIGAAGAAVFAFTSRMAAQGDEVAKTSRRLGLSTAALSELRHAAELSTVKVATFDMAMQRFSRRTAEAAQGTGEAEAALKELGIQLLDADGRLKSSDVLLGEVANAMQGVGSESDKVRLAMKLFDSEGVKLLDMLSKGKAGLDDMRQAARDAGKVWDTEAAAAAERFTTNVEQLKGVVEGLSISLAGPLIQALGDASKAMLEAQRRGESFFATLVAGFSRMFVGDDANQWQREFVNATDDLLKAQNELDRGRAAMRGAAGAGISASIDVLEKRLADAQAEVNRLLGIKDIIAPDAPPEPVRITATRTPTGAVGDSKDPALEEAFKQGEAAEGAFERILAVTQARRDLDEEERERRKAHLDEMTRIELEAAMQQGEIVEGAAERDRIVREQMYEIARQNRARELQENDRFWSNMSGLMNTGSKDMFKIGKAFALAKGAIEGHEAVISAYKWGSSIGGPWVGAAFAAAAATATLNMLNNIRSQQFGGGGGTPVAPTQGSSGVSPVGAGGGGQQQRERPIAHTTVVLPATDLTSTSAVRQMLLGLTEEIEANGGSLTVR